MKNSTENNKIYYCGKKMNLLNVIVALIIYAEKEIVFVLNV